MVVLKTPMYLPVCTQLNGDLIEEVYIEAKKRPERRFDKEIDVVMNRNKKIQERLWAAKNPSLKDAMDMTKVVEQSQLRMKEAGRKWAVLMWQVYPKMKLMFVQ
ncbi:hypothetical protein NDU88_001782 [Pleurodeles waltl]|uniref:Uncharacterized protein n=1 Tax=Pleurodeles waltl TaxID=8319 RepID=A0AAV7T077_PLEWA|nr:hypothetical protein NDU88_001782 [Pleurodeles waltl]